MEPYIIQLSETESKGGKLSFIENPTIPFDVKRLYWIYDIENETSRGGHCHINSDRVIICLNGEVNIKLENSKREHREFKLSHPTKVLFFPRMHWITMNTSRDAIVIVAVSCRYEDDKYLKDYEEFLRLGLC